MSHPAMHHRSREAVEATGRPLCGHPLGDGKTCAREQGWGTSATEGPCKDHTPDALMQKARIKAAFLESYADQPKSVKKAAADAGSSVVGIHRLRKEDPDFDREVEALRAAVDKARIDLVEDSVFARIVDPSTNADTLRMFYLQNRAKDRWRNTKNIDVTKRDGAPAEQKDETVAAWEIGDGRILNFRN